VKSAAMLRSRGGGLEYSARPPVTRLAGGRAHHLGRELHLGGHLVRPSTTIEPSSSTLARSPSTAHRSPSITGKRRHRRLGVPVVAQRHVPGPRQPAASAGPGPLSLLINDVHGRRNNEPLPTVGVALELPVGPGLRRAEPVRESVRGRCVGRAGPGRAVGAAAGACGGAAVHPTGWRVMRAPSPCAHSGNLTPSHAPGGLTTRG
jgi:hypothetical protein